MVAPKARHKKTKKTNLRPLILALLIGGPLIYGTVYFKDRIFSAGSEKNTANQPWYKEHTQPPKLVRLPDTPLIVAAIEAEIDPDIRELTPKRPLKTQPSRPRVFQPRINNVDITAKPQPPATVYEEALPQDVYTPATRSLETDPPPVTTNTQAQPRWMKYALKMDVPVNKPMIAIVIDDLGLDRKRSARTIALPGPLTMAFIPYAKHLDKQTATARNNGHELLVHLPMEPLNAKLDAGPNHLNTHLAHEDLLDRIHWNLERFNGYVGVNNHMGSRATADKTVMNALMAELRNREMLFLDSRTNAKSVGAQTALREGVPFAERNVFLDNVNEKAAVLKQLRILERVSRKTGFAVGIGHPRDGTIAALKEWLPLAKQNGFILVPISQIVLKNQQIS